MDIYNSLHRKRETFTPLTPDQVSIYACGITPYSSSHLGHGVAAVRFNVIRQFLKFNGYQVTFVQNITNVDDKLIQRGFELGRSPIDLADEYVQEYRELLGQLGIEPPDREPDVISYMAEIIRYVEKLISLGYAYATDLGNVYFDVRKKDNYGALSGRNLEDTKENTRIESEQDKSYPLDFALWKRDDHPELSWDSPWGRGRPGWHIECSVMSNSILGPQIDIHCGGLDLIFPHHENEIAQCEAHNGSSFANYWMHIGLLNIDGQKMSKSLGNFITLREALDKYGSELIKFVILKHHYRSEINFTDEIFSENLNVVLKILRAFDLIEGINVDESYQPENQRLQHSFMSVMESDLNTPQAMVLLLEALDEAVSGFEKGQGDDDLSVISNVKSLFQVLGLFNTDETSTKLINEMLKFQSIYLNSERYTIESLAKKIKERERAREEKNYEESDAIRHELHEAGIKLLDSQFEGTSWQFRVI